MCRRRTGPIRSARPPARDSYLNIPRIIEAAQAAGAEAIHPGYGFLSENPAFAEACAAAGIIFVGPPASAMRAMGSKSAAKALMEKSAVPLLPGYHGDRQDAGFPGRPGGADRLSGGDQGGLRRWRPRHAGGDGSRGFRRGPGLGPAGRPPRRSATTGC